MGDAQRRPVVLVVAGSDSSGGAGIVADIATGEALGAGIRLAVTAVTAQTDTAVEAIHLVPPALLSQQIEAALRDGRIGAIKIGMLGSAAAVDAVAASLEGVRCPVVLDPVLASTSGALLLDEAGIARLLEYLMPRVTVMTPNLPELALLSARLGPIASRRSQDVAESVNAALLIHAGAHAVLVKGGHGEGQAAEDVLFRAEPAEPIVFSAPRVAVALRGTGCRLSTAIAVHLAAGADVETACRRAKDHLTGILLKAVRTSSRR